MRRIMATTAVLAAICSLTFAGDPETDFGASVRKFSAARYKLAQDLSSRLNLPLPDQAGAFFRAATTGHWEAVSDHFERVKEQGAYGRPIPQLRNELWAPIQETMGIWEVWVGWKEDSALLALFYEPVLSSIPKGSIYFGGTDYGRFVITSANETSPTRSIYCITQNALSDPIYAAYLRATYTNVWVPEQADIDRAMAQYVHEVEAGIRSNSDDTVITAGRVRKWGVMGVMALHGIISQMTFEHNKASHSFFVEESYVLDWMYPYLEPCGLIMKLNTTPMQSLPKEAISRDQAFWTDCVDRLEKHEGFAGNQEARQAFSKLRSAIAGLYAYRKLFAQSEAAFQQAIRLCPSSPEANFRFAELCEEHGQPDRAIRTMEEFLPLAPMGSTRQAEDYIRYLKEQVQNQPSNRTR